MALFLCLSLPACGADAGPGEADAEHEALSGTDIAAQSEAAGISWSWPAEEIEGLTQRIVGSGAEAAVLIHPTDQDLPRDVAIYLRTWDPVPPSINAPPILDLIDRGYAVIYPTYRLPDTPAAEARDNAIQGIRAAVEELDAEPAHLIAIGYVSGGAIAFDYASLADEVGLPVPKHVLAIYPDRAPDGVIPPADHSQIPADTRLLIATSTDHRVPGGWAFIREMLAEASQIPPDNRDLFVAEPEPGLSTGDAMADSFSKIWRAASRWLDQNGALRAEPGEGVDRD